MRTTATEAHKRDKPVALHKQSKGLYDSQYEHDACGISLVCDIKGKACHSIVELGIQALCNLEHRGALGADALTGDGAGIMIQIPDSFLRAVVDFQLPSPGCYATGVGYFPRDERAYKQAVKSVEQIVRDEGLHLIGWRDVPSESSHLGPNSLATMPRFRQIFISSAPYDTDNNKHNADSTPCEPDSSSELLAGADLDRKVYIARKRMEHEIGTHRNGVPINIAEEDPTKLKTVYFPSLSSRTLVYKGMLTSQQLAVTYPDLRDKRMKSAIALVHARFSTNTFPSWSLAHPFRIISHNGEINTIRGNRNWMRARESMMSSPLIADLHNTFPVCTPNLSDSASFDEVLEVLTLGGYSLPEAMLMMIPEPWEHHKEMDAARKALYQYNSARMEPWDGPASIVFTDGTVVGAMLDRNGLRPVRYCISKDGLVVMASEAGVADIPQSEILEKGRLQPGSLFLIDTSKGRVISDKEVKSRLAAAHPYQSWIADNMLRLQDLTDEAGIPPNPNTSQGQDLTSASTPNQNTAKKQGNGQQENGQLAKHQRMFGHTVEEHKLILAPMAKNAVEAIGSMGSDTPSAVLSDLPRPIYDYFKQLFAQVTNPPLDAIREKLVTSLYARLGAESNIFAREASSCRVIHLDSPILTNEELARLVDRTTVISALYPVVEGGAGLRRSLQKSQKSASEAIEAGANILVISDRGGNEKLAPVPSLLALSAIHQHLIRERTRVHVGLISETGDAREVHHLCLHLGYGANAVNPYMAFDTITDMVAKRMYGCTADITNEAAHQNFVKAGNKGILKVMSKMGISTVASYTGAQIFEAVGLDKEMVDEYFTGTTSHLSGIGLDEIADCVAKNHQHAYPLNRSRQAHRSLEAGGEYQWRREGEYHLFNPRTVFKLQHATRERRYDIFREYTNLVDEQSKHLCTLRGLFKIKTGLREPVDIDKVEPVSAILRRFSTGAMSYGSISAETHETLAIAMNRMGGKSNTGEGGENPERYKLEANGDSRRSAIKQVASGRFGVTSEYLVNADDIQIKMAQGAKPGEGGQLPGYKVYPWIAETRYSTPGVGLISPPPHHDIYSIEDLAQLIHDLKNANSNARIHVKLVSEVGVGTVAAGVSKAHADVVLISGHDGGTGAAPLTSIKHTGTSWELGLAETQQTLLLNNLRDRITVQVDGKLKTGRDVMIAALLGAEEFGFATAPLVVMGCVMMRVCHLDTCPVGIATQNPELRKKFAGQPEFVINFFEFIATEVRTMLAQLGFHTLEEAIGQVELLDTERAIKHWKANKLDLSPILHTPSISPEAARHRTTSQDHGIERALDQTLIQLAAGSLENGTPMSTNMPIRNVNRTVGTLLGSEVTRRYGARGLPDDTIVIRFQGSAGNSFGAFLPRGVTLHLRGEANDYVGKGLSGGRIVISPSDDVDFIAEHNVIAGNVIGYGATSGEIYLRGIVGERFCVRNSGVTAVVEGVGDHGCEYMTGGRVVVLGSVGRNFAAGMSGGLAFVYDIEEKLHVRVNMEMVELEQPDADDLVWLKTQIERHRGETGSAVASYLLRNWDASVECFTKITPNDYKRVLQATAQAEAEGTDPLTAIMASAHG